MPTSEHEDITIVESEASRNNIEHEVATGEALANDGERKCLLMTVGAKRPKPVTFQCAEVHKALLSVSKCADMGVRM